MVQKLIVFVFDIGYRFGKRPEVRKIIGIDINADAIESAKSNFENEKASFVFVFDIGYIYRHHIK